MSAFWRAKVKGEGSIRLSRRARRLRRRRPDERKRWRACTRSEYNGDRRLLSATRDVRLGGTRDEDKTTVRLRPCVKKVCGEPNNERLQEQPL
jgi:hypothetical protein